MNKEIKQITQQIIDRSAKSRAIYLERMARAQKVPINRKTLSCGNLAHAMAAMSASEKQLMKNMQAPNIGIITAYNDMLSAHQPYSTYPQKLKDSLLELGASAQVASGVPAMCDGVTQAQPSMQLSLFSRDNIAMGTAIGLSHNTFDGALYLGICDKIVPGLFIGALSFGHLPAMFVPAGPMPSGISNAEKAHVRQEFAKGNVGKDALLQVESASYHSCGTCTFYGTANSNQMLLECMGLQLPNSSFVNTNTPLRDALTQQSAKTILSMTDFGGSYKPISAIIDERSFVNAIIGLMATGGSTNHTIHLIAMARAAGIILNWDDFNALSKLIPLLCKMYPNGQADVNHFRDAGGMSVVMAQLLKKGLLWQDVETIVGRGLDKYIVEPKLEVEKVTFIDGPKESRNSNVIANIDTPFSLEGGVKLMSGDIGRSIIKTSALKNEHLLIEAPAVVFDSQEALQEDFRAGKLDRDFIAVVRYQGAKSNGMPELHGLMPPLGALQDRGFKVAIITDGRMSGASGKVPSCIHVTPEALDGGVIAKIKNEDMIRIDITKGTITLFDKDTKNRPLDRADLRENNYGFGRELFGSVRSHVNSPEEGASIFKLPGDES